MANGRRHRSQGPRAAEKRGNRWARPSSPTAAPAIGIGWLVIVFAVAVAIRLVVNVQLSKTILYTSPQLDHFEFLTWARSIADGAPIWIPSHAPGYPYFLGFLLLLLDGSVAAARSMQAIMGGGLAVLTTLLGGRFFDRRSGIAAGLLVALYGPLVFVESGLLAEGLFLFLLIAALVALTHPGRSASMAILAGLLLGFATVVRATGIVVLPAFLLSLVADRERARRVLAAGLMSVACLAVVLPVAHSFGEKFDSGLFLQGFGGLNFLLGNDPHGEGVPSARLGGQWDVVSGEAFRAGATTAGEREHYYYARGVDQIRQQPWAFLRILAVKSFWLIQDEEPRDTHSLYFFRQKSLLLRLLPGFGLLFPLSVCGLAMTTRSWRRLLPLLLYLGAVGGSCVLFVVSLRYRLPMIPVLALFAGLALFRFWDHIRHRAWSTVAIWATVFLAAAGVTQIWTHAPSRNVAEELALSASSLERDGHLAEAEKLYRKALEIDEDSAYAWAGIGRTLLRRQNLEAAEQAFRRAIAANPDYSRAHGGLGAVEWMQNRPAAAIESYRRALWLSPDTGFIARDLGKLLVQQGELEEALAVYEQFLLFDPNDQPSLLAVARIAGMLNEPDRGQAAAGRAADLDPGNAEAWILLAMLSSDVGDRETSERAMRQAEALVGTADARVLFAWSVLYEHQGREQEANQMLMRMIAEHPEFDPQRDLLLP